MRALQMSAAVAIALGGCAQILALDDFTEQAGEPLGGTNGAGGGAGSGLGGAGGCTCGLSVPSGWSGPVAVSTSTSASVACDPVWTESLLLGGLGEPGGAVSCSGCGCTPANDAGCAGAQVERFLDSGCTMSNATFGSTANCMSTSGGAGHFQPKPVGVVGGRCAVTGGDELARPAPFAQWMRACTSASVPTSCALADGCVPAPQHDDTALCIYQTSELSCPPGAWQQTFVVATSYSDTRSCDCTCGPPSGGCSAVTTLYTTGSCNNPIVAILDHQAVPAPCEPASSPHMALTQLTAPLAAPCAPAGGSSGAIDVSERTTLCCLR
jgi:hypothetical protein